MCICENPDCDRKGKPFYCRRGSRYCSQKCRRLIDARDFRANKIKNKMKHTKPNEIKNIVSQRVCVRFT